LFVHHMARGDSIEEDDTQPRIQHRAKVG